MYLSQSDVKDLDRVKRLNIINSVSGIKPGNLIGTQSNKGDTNLAIFSSIVHLGSNPGYLGFIMRLDKDVRRHIYQNIKETTCLTVNHIHSHFAKKAHYTSAKFEADVSEFDVCGLTPEYLYDFIAPFVKESTLKMGLKHVESVPITSTETIMVVGQIQHLIIPDHAIDEKGYIDLGISDTIGISGLNRYYKVEKFGEFPYARVGEVPDFSKS